MLDNEKVTLKENAEELADLLTENIPYLLSHYLGKEILTESEREAIISAGSAQDIRIKLLETLADKEEVSLDSVIEGLNATENQRVSARINSFLPEKKPSDDDGSGDKEEDVSLVATSLVDEVIAKAEDTTNSGVDQEQHQDTDSLDQHDLELNDSPEEVGIVNTTSTENNRGSISQDSETPEENVEEETIPTGENLVEASVEVHKMDEDTFTPEDIEEMSDVPDRNVKFHETATVIEDDPSSQDSSVNEPEPEPEPQNNGIDAQNESENDDEDTIDIEKEFVMPPEAENNNIVNVLEESKVSNGGRTMTRMDSNDIIFDGEETPVNGTNKPSTGDEGLDSIMARKALVKQQVQMFEKSSPIPPGEVKYSFRSSAASQEQSAAEAKSEGSNVKNLKNFFQRLSTTPEASTPGGAVKPVGKLKVTFPAS